MSLHQSVGRGTQGARPRSRGSAAVPKVLDPPYLCRYGWFSTRAGARSICAVLGHSRDWALSPIFGGLGAELMGCGWIGVMGGKKGPNTSDLGWHQVVFRLGVFVSIALVLAACRSDRATGTSPISVLSTSTTATADPGRAGATTSQPEVTQPARSDSHVRGLLPDGTSFDVLLEPGLNGEVESMSAAIVIELTDGTSPVVGITSFHRGSTETISFENGVYFLPAGDWTVGIKVYDHVLEQPWSLA